MPTRRQVIARAIDQELEACGDEQDEAKAQEAQAAAEAEDLIRELLRWEQEEEEYQATVARHFAWDDDLDEVHADEVDLDW